MGIERRVDRVYLSLGSNLGNREENLKAALSALKDLARTQLTAVSSVFETEPVGERDQPTFLNLAAEIETALAPLELLNACQDIEKAVGRKPTRRWGPRVVDIDLILWGSAVLDTSALVLPHPRFRLRNFVLQPLCEIAADAIDPVTGKSVLELAQSNDASGDVHRLPTTITP
jgi:2-amino-4-hydroxy-6-hydroxymethyldihydropteridine diphosphokinase